MFDSIKKELAAKYIGGFVRTGLATLSGLLISIGLDVKAVTAFSGTAEPIIVGVIIYGLTLVWSLVNKKKMEVKK